MTIPAGYAGNVLTIHLDQQKADIVPIDKFGTIMVLTPDSGWEATG